VTTRILLAVLALGLAGCSMQADYRAAVGAARDFDHLVDAHQYIAIYESSAPEFRGAIARDNFLSSMGVLERKLGTCAAGKLGLVLYKGSPLRTIITMSSVRNCANGVLTERLTWVVRGRRAVLVKASMASPGLVGG
jgi:hypothetical protein